MQRVPYLIEKLTELSKEQRALTAIDIDLMLDYTRVLYADLLEERKKAGPIITSDIQEKQPNIQEEGKPKVEIRTIPATPSNDLRTVIGINDKYLFISELFKGDKTAYDDAIKELSKIFDKQEVESWIKSNLQSKYHWDAESDTVQTFYSLVERSLS